MSREVALPSPRQSGKRYAATMEAAAKRLDALAQRFAERPSTPANDAAFHAALADWLTDLYRHGGFVHDLTDGKPILHRSDVTIAVTRDGDALTATIARRTPPVVDIGATEYLVLGETRH